MDNDLGFRGIAGQIHERRQAWRDAREQGETTCDVYPFSCKVTLGMVNGIELPPEQELCRCLLAVADWREEHAIAKAKEAEKRRNARFGAMPPAMRGVTFEWLQSQARRGDVVRVCKDYAVTPYERPLLTIFGPVGSGKTTLAAAIANARGMETVWAYIVDLLKHLQGTFGAVGEFSYAVEFQRIVNAPLLILDDLGAEKSTEWAMQELDHIITHRHMYRMPTVVTTNLDMTRQSGRIGSRLRDVKCSQLVRMDGMPDFRLGGGK